MFDYLINKFDATSFVEAKEIEYKRVDDEDFKNCNYTVHKVEIIPDAEGFVTDELYNKIDIHNSSTDVLNIPTGSGKTTAIYQKIQQILEEDKTSVVILATPFISLVKKDLDRLNKKYNIDIDVITDYSDLQNDLDIEQTSFLMASHIAKAYIKDKRIHITTINALLGNPGDVSFMQKSQKSNYFRELYRYCNSKDAKKKKKVYLFFDEIHASIHNFKNEYINNLTLWKDVSHKCVVSTATYTEPVNIVVKHLAYLTDDTINIFECDRYKKQNISPLDIVFTPEPHSVKNAGAVKYILSHWIKDNLNENNNFHIISYSKKFAKMLNAYLLHEGLVCQLLTSETKNTFNQNRNNVGTNFCTGVDIDKDGDLLIIIFPSKYKDELVKGEEGIFYDGLPTVLQAMARLRSVGRVLLIISPMKVVIDDEPSKELLNMIPIYRNYLLKEEKVTFAKETFLKDEKKDLNDFITKRDMKFSEESKRYQSEIKGDGKTRPHIQYPHKDTFVLERGQEYLKFRNYKSGKYITPYVLWAAVHDQFLNCSLDTVYYLNKLKTKLYLIEDNIIQNILDYINYDYDKVKSKDFESFYKEVLIKLQENSTENKRSVVKVYIDGKLLTKQQVKTSTKIYWAIVGCYFRLLGYPFKSHSKDAYLTLMLKEQTHIELETIPNLDCSIYYDALKHIILDFMRLYKGESYTLSEIAQLPFFDEKLITRITDIHKHLKRDDPVLYYLDKIGSFFKTSSINGIIIPKSVVKVFLDNYIILGESAGKYKRRKIKSSILSESENEI